MITNCIPVVLCLLVTLQLIIPTHQQDIESRRYSPHPNKCERQGRCGSKEGYIEEAHHDDVFKLDKDRPTELSRDDWPVPPRPSGSGDDNSKPAINSGGGGGHIGGYNPKPADDADDELKPDGRPSGGGGGYRGGYNPKPVNRDEDLNPSGRPSGGGYGGGGGYNPKPVDDTDGGLKPGERPNTGGGGYRGGYNPKPVDRDENLNPGGRPSGGGGNRGGRNPKPVIDRDEDLRPGGGRPSGGGGGYGSNGGYNPKPVADTDDDLKPARPGNGGGYNPKPVVDRDDYDTDRVDDKSGVGGRPGGGYNPKPAEDDYEIKPSRHGGGYKTNDDRKTDKVDLGGYDQPKNDDYNDYKDDEKEDKSDGYDEDDKPISIEDRDCICVPYYQCKDGHIVTDGGGIIDARKRPNPELPLDGNINPPSCGPYHVCCNTPETSTVKPYEHRCGVRNPSGINSRILSPSNKGEADFGEWPWQAAVLKAEGKVNIFQCGGVLIDKYHVLTVAHCVFHLYQYNEYPLKVRLGEWDTQTTTEFLAHEDYRVSKIIIHPEFRNTSLWNDVAVLRLQDPVLFAPHIDTICLPKYDEVFSGQNCVVTGWGKDAYKGGTFSNVMKEVALEVIDNYKCEEMLRKTRLGRFFQLHEGFLCAGGEQGLDSCKGDGGGPLVCYRKDKSYALAGIVSWGIDCGQPDVPGVYVKIQKYLDFISKTTGVALQDYWPKN